VNESRERVLRALRHERPDRVPLFESYWPEFLAQWSGAKGLPAAAIHDHYGNDVTTVVPDESPWPSLVAELAPAGANGHHVLRNGWGAVVRTADDAYFSEELSVALESRVDPDRVVFESPLLEARYVAADAQVRAERGRYALFGKTGGPFKRTSFLRGYTRFLFDLAEDPAWAQALVERTMAHLTAVGVAQLQRWGDALVGMQINDDCCALRGPLISPNLYARVCLPSLVRMVQAYKAAGAQIVYMHCDGNCMPLVDMWVAAGIDAIHPCEPRAGVDIVALRRRHGSRLAFMGAMDNCYILPQGSRAQIEQHVRALVEFGQEGGLVLGGHSIGPDISVERYDWAMAARNF